jgi:FtsP/CotA-like multicopper oxidase with cupredoxin domain
VAVSRRDFLFLSLGLGGGARGAGWLARHRPAYSRPALAAGSPHSALETGYDAMIAPPDELGPRALDDLTIPPGPGSGSRSVDLWVAEQALTVARHRTMAAWTFNGRIPGPIIRAGAGEELSIRFRNLGGHPHNLHFHGAHSPADDGWEPVPAGAETRRRIRAGPPGLHPYHCDMTPAPEHISRGLYGAFIVDPPGGRAAAREFVLVLGGFDTDGDGRSDLYGWNGVAGYYMKYPIKVPAGELVRIYLVNMVGDEPVVSFHLHAQVFDVYRSGSDVHPDERTDVVTLAQSERAILEFRLPERGRYMFHPHQARLAERGAMGWFAAV